MSSATVTTKHKTVNSWIRIPRAFYTDHVERDLPAPELVKTTSTHYWVHEDDPHLPELLDDARHYSDFRDWDCRPGDYLWGVVTSARATVAAIERHQLRDAEWAVYDAAGTCFGSYPLPQPAHLLRRRLREQGIETHIRRNIPAK